MRAYYFYKEIRFEIIMIPSHIPIAESSGPIISASQSLSGRTDHAWS
jgi:hypothetical protein